MENTIELVQKAKQGNAQAFEALIQNEKEKLYRTAYLYTRNKEDALDIVQESIYKAFISIETLNQPEYFRTWITKILIRKAYSFLKGKQKFVSIDEMTTEFVSPMNLEQNSENKIHLSEAISSLNHDYQSAIILYYYHDLRISEIAEVIGRPENTVKTYLRRAKIELRIFFEEENKNEKRPVR